MQTSDSKKSLQVKIIFLALLAITLVLYWPVTGHDFINFDDNDYIYGNNIMQQGLTWHGFLWAFGYHAFNWHPLTWMSHMLDCQLFGLDAGKHHLVNVLIHAVNGALFFLALYLLTGLMWRSVLVATLFLWHPLHVESVAWVAERKDLLSGFFFMTILLTWTCYVSVGRGSRQTKIDDGSAEPRHCIFSNVWFVSQKLVKLVPPLPLQGQRGRWARERLDLAICSLSRMTSVACSVPAQCFLLEPLPERGHPNVRCSYMQVGVKITVSAENRLNILTIY